MSVMRSFVLALLTLVLAAAPAAAQTAVAASTLEEAAGSLRSDPLYVHPDAELDDPAAVRALIDDPNVAPVYVAVLPDDARNEAGGSTDALVYALRDLL